MDWPGDIFPYSRLTQLSTDLKAVFFTVSTVPSAGRPLQVHMLTKIENVAK